MASADGSGARRTGMAEGPKVLLAGGKSGGHVFPALAVAEVLAERGWTAGFLGTADGMERKIAETREIPFFAVDAAPVLGRGLFGKLVALLRTLRSSLQARRVVRAQKGAVLIGTGGFVSAPGVLGAKLAGVPVLLLEPNASAGFANRWLSRLAGAAALAHEETKAELRCPAHVTGVPVREAFFEQPAASTLDAQELRVLVLGGSQGARELNRRLPSMLRAAAEACGRPMHVVHQTGAAGLDDAARHYAEVWTDAGVSRFVVGDASAELVTFIDDMPSALGAAHLVVSRAGAITLAELSAVGRASVLIPLPIAAGHQGANARALEQAGAALCVDESQLDAPQTVEKLEALVADAGELATMGAAAAQLAHPGAAAKIADLAMELAGRTEVAR